MLQKNLVRTCNSLDAVKDFELLYRWVSIQGFIFEFMVDVVPEVHDNGAKLYLKQHFTVLPRAFSIPQYEALPSNDIHRILRTSSDKTRC